MKVTKSQKIYSAVLGLGVCALLYDRCFNDPKVAPRAVPVNASLVLDHPEMQVNTPEAVVSVAENDIVSRLQRLQANLPAFPRMRDAFTPSPAWIANTDKEEAGPSERAIKFQGAHRLRAILDMRGQKQAIVDDSLVKVGQSLDGFELTSVDNLHAIFVDRDTQAVLTLETASLSQSTQQDP
jgi:hypothetical protein